MIVKIKDKQINVLDHKRREELKQKDSFKVTNLAFNYHHDNSIRKNGAMMVLVRSLCPSDADDFANKYIDWRLHNINEEYLLANNVRDFMNQTGLDLETAVIYLMIYLVDNTWEGCYHENQSVDMMLQFLYDNSNNHSWDVVKTNSEIDSKYAIDYFIKKDGKITAGVQLKPKSFFESNRTSLKNDIDFNKRAMLKYKAKTGIRVGFWLYEDIRKGKRAIEVK